MKTLLNSLMLSVVCFVVVPGCGDAAPKSVIEAAEKSEIQKYEEMVAADAAAMSASQAPAEAAPVDAPKAE